MFPEPVPPSVGLAPLVRMRANCSCSERVAVIANRLPCGPSEEATCVKTVPSENVHVTVNEAAPGAP